MRHRVYGKHLGRDKNQRTALFRGLIRSLILEESITTTSSKAKAIKGLVDRLISKGKENTQASKRVILATLPQKEVNQKLLTEIAPRYPNRTSGFTTVTKLGVRAGDGAMKVRMSLVVEESSKGKVLNNTGEEKTEKEINKNKKTKKLKEVGMDNSAGESK